MRINKMTCVFGLNVNVIVTLFSIRTKRNKEYYLRNVSLNILQKMRFYCPNNVVMILLNTRTYPAHIFTWPLSKNDLHGFAKWLKLLIGIICTRLCSRF